MEDNTLKIARGGKQRRSESEMQRGKHLTLPNGRKEATLEQRKKEKNKKESYEKISEIR